VRGVIVTICPEKSLSCALACAAAGVRKGIWRCGEMSVDDKITAVFLGMFVGVTVIGFVFLLL
jgi:hypothetical protein